MYLYGVNCIFRYSIKAASIMYWQNTLFINKLQLLIKKLPLFLSFCLQYCFAVTFRRDSQRSYELRAESESDCKAWIQAVRQGRYDVPIFETLQEYPIINAAISKKLTLIRIQLIVLTSCWPKKRNWSRNIFIYYRSSRVKKRPSGNTPANVRN